MASSSTRRIQNDVSFYEESSDHKISPNFYYVVRVGLKVDTSEKIRNVAKIMAKTVAGDDGKPLVVYTCDTEIYMLFSSLEKNETHHLKGSHHALCSFYSSMLSREHQCDVLCSIIEMDSRTKVIVYFQTKIYENAKRSLLKMTKKLLKKDADTLTFSEMTKGVPAWETTPAVDKFGVFYKHHSVGDKEKYSTMSELVDLKNMDKYMSYLFD